MLTQETKDAIMGSRLFFCSTYIKQEALPMKCPKCGERSGISVENGDGYSHAGSPIKECASCGLVWRVKPAGNGSTAIDIINDPRQKTNQSFAQRV